MNQRWTILAVLTFARTVMGLQFQSVAAVSPFILDYFQMSYAVLGTIIGLYLFPGVAVALPGSVLAQLLTKRIKRLTAQNRKFCQYSKRNLLNAFSIRQRSL